MLSRSARTRGAMAAVTRPGMHENGITARIPLAPRCASSMAFASVKTASVWISGAKYGRTNATSSPVGRS